MSTPIILVDSLFAQSNSKKPVPSQPPTSSTAENTQSGPIWMFTSGLLFLVLVGLVVYGKLEIKKMTKKIKLEEYKNQEIQKKLKLALQTIRKMETNPDLVHSREFNLDYLRMRMDEETFNFVIVNQVKIKVKQLISVALRPNPDAQVVIGIANTAPRQVDEIFDVIYEMEHGNKRTKRVLFRIGIKLAKLPTQSTSTTINEIINCIEKYLSIEQNHENWQPTIQGRLVRMDWDQKAKPTPLLVLSQAADGVNVSFRTKPNKRATAQ